MTPGTYNIELYQGDLLSVKITAMQGTVPDVPVDLTLYTATAQMKTSKSATEVTLEFTCTIDADPTTGVIVLSALPEDTAALIPGSYVYDLQIANGDGTDIRTLLKGKVKVTQEVTKPAVVL